MNNRKKIANCVISFLLSAVLVFSGILGYVVPAQAVSACAGTITVAVERFAIGQGYLIEPYMTTFNEGDTYEVVCRRVLEDNEYSYTTGGASFYLSGIDGADGDRIDIPECIAKIGPKKIGIKTVNPPDNSAVNEYAGNTKWLGEFSYSQMSGWMYSVGNDDGYEFPGVGMDGRTVKDGDVFRLQFTVWGYGEDLTGVKYADSSTVYYEVGDKTVLTRKIAQINQNKENWFAVDGCKEAYDNAVKVLQKLDATQKELDDALAKLPAEEPVFPDKVTLQETDVTLYPGDTLQLKAVLTPDNVNQSVLIWSSSDSKVASVDQEGLVTAGDNGTADITVTTQNKKTAVCHITVEDRAITKINLNMARASLEVGNSLQLKVVSYEPENATEKLEVSFSSDNKAVADVNEEGLVTALKSGTANITAATKGGVSAVCRVTAGASKELAQAMEAQIARLPEPGNVTEDTAGEVMEVWEEYQTLSDETKAEMDPLAVTRLEALREEAETVIRKQEQIAEVCDMLREIPSADKISLTDEGMIQKVRSAYDALDAGQQGKIDEALKKRLIDAENRISELKAEADSAGKQIQAFPDAVTADNAADAVNLWQTYDALAEDQKTYLGKTCEMRMEQIRNQTVSCITETVNAVDRSKTFDLDSADVQNFITISNVCEEMDQQQMNLLSAKTRTAITDIRQWIGEQIHTSGTFSVSADWYIRLVVKNGESSTALKHAVSDRYSSLASIIYNKTISYEDVRTGKTYTPTEALKISVDLSGVKDLNNPVVDTVSVSGSKVMLKELESQYEKNVMIFAATHTGTLLLIDNPIAVTGISVPSTESVGIGNSISLDITFKPFNATTDKSVVLKSSDSSVVKVNSDGTLKGMKPGSVNVTVSLKSDPSIQAVCRVTVTDKANKLKKSVDQVMKETSAYMLSIDKKPTIGSEWFVLGLARSGKSL
ncbi:MAG: Ig-like domain-containing protein, partial [Lachnospiraceae bacterium]